MQVGDLAPDFTLTDDAGVERTLSTMLADGPVVLFFYPMASSGGCTAESCRFRDLAAEFAQFGAQRVGISADSVEKQRTFSTSNSFDFPLLSDPGAKVAKQFDAKRSWLPKFPTKRRTFVIGTDRRIIEVIASESKMDVHPDGALEALRRRHAA